MNLAIILVFLLSVIYNLLQSRPYKTFYKETVSHKYIDISAGIKSKLHFKMEIQMSQVFQEHYHTRNTFKDHLPTPFALQCCGSSISRPLLSLRKLTKWKWNNMARLAMLCVTDNNPKWGRGDVDGLSKSCESAGYI